MSDLLIKGLKLPERTNELRLIIHPNGQTIVSNYTYWEETEAIEIPDHGDLIDQDEYRDEFMNGVYALCSDDSDNYRANAIIDLFDEAPTVIPVEPGEEET